jgi:hypothetical protein
MYHHVHNHCRWTPLHVEGTLNNKEYAVYVSPSCFIHHRYKCLCQRYSPFYWSSSGQRYTYFQWSPHITHPSYVSGPMDTQKVKVHFSPVVWKKLKIWKNVEKVWGARYLLENTVIKTVSILGCKRVLWLKFVLHEWNLVYCHNAHTVTELVLQWDRTGTICDSLGRQ